MEQILYEIDGNKYVLIEVLYTETNKAKIEKAIENHECIYQGIKEIKKSFWGGHAILKYLVPEQKLIAFNKAL